MKQINCILSIMLLLAACFLLSCATNKSIANTNVLSIEFGYSGGFANQHTKKVLDNEGCLYQISDTHKTLLCKVGEDTVLDLFKDASQLGETIRDPGNMSYYIVVKTKNEEKKWVWSNSTSNIDSIWSIYRKLNELK